MSAGQRIIASIIVLIMVALIVLPAVAQLTGDVFEPVKGWLGTKGLAITQLVGGGGVLVSRFLGVF